MKDKRKLYLLCYYIFSLFFLELFFRIATDAHNITTGFGLFLSIVFSLPLVFIFSVLGSVFKDDISFIISGIILFLLGFLYSSQLVYHDFFRTFYSFYSAGNAVQVLDFWKEIVAAVWANLLWIFPFFLPFVFLLVYGRKVFSFRKANFRLILYMLLGAIMFHSLSLLIVANGEREQNSAYDLYFNNSSPILSVEKLGLLTSMRIDFKRALTGWSLVLEEPLVVSVPRVKQNSSSEDSLEVTKEEYNVMAIDFEKLIDKEQNETLVRMHQYFTKIPPTKKNEYTGKFNGYNLILLTAEGFSPYAVNEEITPTLHKLVHEGYQFSNFYVPLWDVSTSDGEYVALNGLIPKSGIWSFSKSGENHVPFVLGNQLKKLGYKTVAYHNHTYDYYDRHVSHPNMGYVYKGIGNGLNIKKTWPASDLEMMEQSIKEYISEESFHAYYMTMSGHLEYNFAGNQMAAKNKEFVSHLKLTDQAKAYLATQIELDKAMAYLLEELEKAGIMEKTLIVLSADHYPYGLDFETINEFEGKDVERNFDLYKSDLIIYATGMDKTVIDKPVSSLDILPTVSNLLGLEYDSRLLMGVDVFSDAESLVLFRNKSFITEKGKYNAETKEFIGKDGMKVEKEYLDSIIAKVNQKFYYSSQIVEYNYYQFLSNLNEQ
ncbi:LTA synthase family protein [Sutcliffiella deserti]|uniref:LTA synthase family protein n=1 Tax=Sutcliffiella deserti TaxID=2875501 RepID=UPI001CBF38BB|nr:alkaline phosphatase family protein [Sutcliffiella deserti]